MRVIRRGFWTRVQPHLHNALSSSVVLTHSSSICLNNSSDGQVNTFRFYLFHSILLESSSWNYSNTHSPAAPIFQSYSSFVLLHDMHLISFLLTHEDSSPGSSLLPSSFNNLSISNLPDWQELNHVYSVFCFTPTMVRMRQLWKYLGGWKNLIRAFDFMLRDKFENLGKR
jgi:hypothetical protein